MVAERGRVGDPGRAARRRGASPCWCPPDLSPPPPAPQRMDGGGGGGASHGLAGLPLMRSAAARGAAGPREAEGAGPGVGGLACRHPWRERPGDRVAGAEATRRDPRGGRAECGPARRHPRRCGPACAPTQGAPVTAASCPPCAPNSSTSESPGKFWEESGRLLHLESLSSWWTVQALPSLASELRSRGRVCAAIRKHSAPCRGRK